MTRILLKVLTFDGIVLGTFIGVSVMWVIGDIVLCIVDQIRAIVRREKND